MTLETCPDVNDYPYAADWYKHVAEFKDDFNKLDGDFTRPFAGVYGRPLLYGGNYSSARNLVAGTVEEERAWAGQIRQIRLAQDLQKKQRMRDAPKVLVTVDVKPLDDDLFDYTIYKDMDRFCREVYHDGLVWGESRVLPSVGSEIQKLRMTFVVQDVYDGCDLLDSVVSDMLDFDTIVESVEFVDKKKLRGLCKASDVWSILVARDDEARAKLLV